MKKTIWSSLLSGVLVCILVIQPVTAVEPVSPPDEVTPESPMPSLMEIPRQFWSDLKDVPSVVSRLERYEWARVAAGAGIIGGLAVWDEDIRDYARAHYDDFYEDFADFGEWKYASAFFLGTHLAGRAVKHKGMAETGAAGVESLLLTAVPVLLVQGITGRKRPEDGGAYNWFSFSDGHGASGHTATAFVTATVLDRRLCSLSDDMTHMQRFSRYAGKTALYGTAACTAMERINDDKHFASDVAIGGAIAFMCTTYVMNRRDNSELRLVVDDNSIGLCLVREF